jgi:hypothetical protein
MKSPFSDCIGMCDLGKHLRKNVIVERGKPDALAGFFCKPPNRIADTSYPEFANDFIVWPFPDKNTWGWQEQPRND